MTSEELLSEIMFELDDQVGYYYGEVEDSDEDTNTEMLIALLNIFSNYKDRIEAQLDL